jgi:hypothetical protein
MLRNIFSKIFFCAFLFGIIFIFSVNKVYAFADPSGFGFTGCTMTDGSFNNFAIYDCDPPGGRNEYAIMGQRVYCDDNACTTNAVNYQKTADKKYGAVESTGCSLNPFKFDAWKCLGYLISRIFYWFFYVINLLLGKVLELTSYFLDITIYYTIVKFKGTFADIGNFMIPDDGQNSFGLIYYIWGMLRDFLNLLVFIIIIYTAVRSMFDGYSETKNKFIGLLVFSIVTNFSLLFVKLAIDLSNILALEAYTLGIQPTSFESFDGFRTVQNGQPGFGPLLMSVISWEELKKAGSQDENVQQAISDQTNSAFFELGRIIVNIGLIYMFIFLIGMLLARAMWFLFAMLTAPFLAADVFFTYFNKEGPTKDLADALRNITNYVRADFLDGLIKGPLLIFFLYLLTVLGKAVFSSGFDENTIRSISQNHAVAGIGGQFASSIIVFFKFIVFFTLTRVLLNKLNQIHFSLGGKSQVGDKLFKYGFAAINRANRIAGFAGRNTVGRLANRLNLNAGLTRLSQAANQRLANPNTGIVGRSLSRLTLGATNLGIRGTNSLIRGTYNPTNAAVGALGTRLGQRISNITGIKTEDLTKRVGEADKAGGFQDRAKKRAEDSAKKIKEESEEAGKTDNIQVNKNTKEYQEESQKVKVKIGGQELTLAALEQVMANGNYKGENITDEGERKKFLEALESAKNGSDPKILNDIEKARNEAVTNAKNKIASDNKKAVLEQGAAGVRSGGTLTQKLTGQTLFRTAKTRMDVRREVARGMSKEGSTAVDNDKKLSSSITGELYNNALELLQDVEKSLNNPDIRREYDKLPEEQRKKFDSNQDTIAKFVEEVSQYALDKEGKLDSGKLKDFNNNVFKKLSEAKVSMLDTLAQATSKSVINRSGNTITINSPVEKLNKARGRLIVKIKNANENYKKTLESLEPKKEDATAKPVKP